MHNRPIFAVFAIACVALAATPADAKQCFKKAATGEATTADGAKFQVDEALLQATDWGAWAAWMASGGTPGYSFGPRRYSCKQGGGWGWECQGSATLCKL
jgi:hypothetical protein